MVWVVTTLEKCIDIFFYLLCFYIGGSQTFAWGTWNKPKVASPIRKDLGSVPGASETHQSLRTTIPESR